MLFTVSTVKDSVPGLKEFVARNLAGGVDHMFLFVDDGKPRVVAALNRLPHVTAIATGESWWQGKRPRQLNARQRINANVVKALLVVDSGPDDWLFHIDGDEALQVDRAALATLPPEVTVVRAPPLEAVSRKKWPGGQVTHFKRMLQPDELVLLHVLGALDEPTNGRYFHGHIEGKSGLRPTLDRWITLHAVHDVDQQQVPSTSDAAVARLLHYESWSGEEFVRKWTNILESGTKVSFRPGREPTAVALRTLLESDLPQRKLRDYLLRIFERTTEDDFDTLRDLGLLEKVDPLAGRHRPEALTAQREAEIRAMLAAIEPENKWPFHTGRTSRGMVTKLGIAADRLAADPTHAALAERARAVWTLPEELLRSVVKADRADGADGADAGDASGEGEGAGPDADGETVLDESGEAAGPLA
ncbi:glycosyltransferase family 2 protein [Nocardioides dilutus]